MEIQSTLVECLEPADRDALLDRAVPRRLARGEVLYLAGDRRRRMHLIAGGVVKLTARSGDGRSAILGLALPGEVIGEVAALQDCPQPLDAVAATPCVVLGVDADMLLELMGRNPAAMLELVRGIAQRSRWICDTALERATTGVQGRLAGRLLDLADLLGQVRDGAVEMELPLAQDELGRLAGMCRESACKALKRFKDAGWLDYRGRRVRILRPEALESVRCGGPIPAPAAAQSPVETRYTALAPTRV